VKQLVLEGIAASLFVVSARVGSEIGLFLVKADAPAQHLGLR